jgi:hypothetical protein
MINTLNNIFEQMPLEFDSGELFGRGSFGRRASWPWGCKIAGSYGFGITKNVFDLCNKSKCQRALDPNFYLKR